jgi:hypothetical protein
MNALEIEIAVANFFGHRTNIIVPNVWWGMDGLDHECDLLVVSGSGYASEIEIKVTGSDIKRDLKKGRRRNYSGQEFQLAHRHCDIIKKLYFAVPLKLAQHPDIPEWAGILAVKDIQDTILFPKVVTVRPPHVNKDVRPLKDYEREKLLRLGVMRIWSLKAKVFLLF